MLINADIKNGYQFIFNDKNDLAYLNRNFKQSLTISSGNAQFKLLNIIDNYIVKGEEIAVLNGITAPQSQYIKDKAQYIYENGYYIDVSSCLLDTIENITQLKSYYRLSAINTYFKANHIPQLLSYWSKLGTINAINGNYNTKNNIFNGLVYFT